MGIYFGTDGIRGVYGEDLTPNIAYVCGNSLSRKCKNKKVLLGRDTRTTGDVLAMSFANGLLQNGVNVIDVGVVTTPVVAQLTRQQKCDFGVMISASHNPPSHNGIKLFDKNGYKISDELENELERKFMMQASVGFDEIGRLTYKPRLVDKYVGNITKNIVNLSGLHLVIDCGNGGASRVAKKVFERAGAKVTAINCKTDGKRINCNCGALHPEGMAKKVVREKADLGLAFDGDADRIIACDEKGNLLDGDDILYLLARHFENQTDAVVGTSMTNKGLEEDLSRHGISLIRVSVGDKYVIEKMLAENLMLGGETSGHIIIKPYCTTGDGVMTGLLLAEIIKKNGKKISSCAKYKKYPQIIKNVEVFDKYEIVGNKQLAQEVSKTKKNFDKKGRVLLRASGTESKIRIMCEHKSQKTAEKAAENLEKMVKMIIQNQNNNSEI